ncbi:bifunctional ADP-dependent NAD(P)H-hydrate dehydratase/NAD(P)H-hydrate epimerase [Pseudaestuariivita atlantica]|uniref:Bifunctional NAD(P)H-hydrate repair enzyme n=1 Tax=Pseudaestuariivita atlantica TaxID=1317121 RepID=A0A0L1JUH7_9RHOB|nr:bifunctional ADP-dependent NAD(P)H-hydrate dehydratase/NAD(P)H-hydrate epimerase [Pseudaestuariivita atlantica]KNG95421.1 hypothetical protein ATO11_02110 [Pseudaestuariivita atlantica]
MTQILTAARMRAIEEQTMAEGGVTGLQLMERAGRGLVTAVLDRWPDLGAGPHRALVLCGPGNNGGDGFVIARRLRDRGWSVAVFLYGKAARLPPDAKKMHDLLAADVDIHGWDVDAIHGTDRPDLIVDAVFGIGLTRPLPAEVAEVLDQKGAPSWKRGHAIRRVAVDGPSGLDLDTGMVPFTGQADDPDFDPWPHHVVRADLTVTFHAPKCGHYLGLGPMMCGALEVVDIGLPHVAVSPLGTAPAPDSLRLASPVLRRQSVPARIWPGSLVPKIGGISGHKFDFGHAMVMAGGVGSGGAGRLAARAALRIGAGLVTVLCPPSALQENACHLDAIMLRAVADADGLGAVIDDRVTAFCLGPGMGTGERTRGLVLAALAEGETEGRWRAPAVVLDADALSAFAHAPETLFDQLHPRAILTPHEGEFARLFPDLAQSRRGPGLSKVDAVRAAASRAGCVILLKGADTVIAEPGGGASLHSAAYGREVPWLATAGAGDVLAGMITGQAASHTGPDLFCVAEAAAWLHVECARSFGPGLIAEDLPEELPKVLRALMA